MIGYKKDSIVTKTGEYANRGYILDVFPYGYENPVRIEFFDDEIESIREFSSDTQLSMKKKDNIEICPFTEFINEKNVEDILERQSLLPRVVKKVSKIEDYLDNNITVYLDLNSIKLAYEKTMNEVLEFKETDQFKIDKYMLLATLMFQEEFFDEVKKIITSSEDKKNENVIQRYLSKVSELENILRYVQNEIVDEQIINWLEE